MAPCWIWVLCNDVFMTYDIQGEVEGQNLTKDAPLAIVLHSLIDG